MSYTALYRAYRPQKFSEVVGQKHIVTTLQNAIKLNKVAHAYLFSGPRGTGKTTLAKIMAKALNCENGPCVEPCDECNICKSITKGMLPDVIEIDAASNNGADDIRELRDGVKFLPSVGRYKVYIIDEVHMLSNAAFNALLKTLEEPPKHVIFILATTEPYKLPNTILSRCQRFDFQAISNEDIIKRLKIVIEKENINIDDEAIQIISESSEGGMRDALSLLDQCISFSTDEIISVDDVLSVSGNVSNEFLLDIAISCLDKNDSTTLNKLDEILKRGKEVPRVVNDLILFLRDLLLYKNNSLLSNKIIYKNQRFIDFSKNISKAIIYHWLDILNDVSNNLRYTNQKRAYIEIALLKMCDHKLNDSISITDRVERIETELLRLEDKIKNINNKTTNQEYKYIQPSLEHINKIKEEAKEIIREQVSNNDEITQDELNNPAIKEQGTNDDITIEEIEDVLNNSTKDKKDELISALKKLSLKYNSQFDIQILYNGSIVAASEDKFIAVLMDEGFCNRLMKYENYVKIIEILRQVQINIKDYYCIPNSIWISIKNDFSKQYKNGIIKPKLAYIRIPVKRTKAPLEGQHNDEFDNITYDLFDKNIVKMED